MRGTLLFLLVCTLLTGALPASAKEVVPCIEKKGKYWRVTPKECVQFTEEDMRLYNSALERLRVYDREVKPLLKRIEAILEKAKQYEKREALLKEMLSLERKKAEKWRSAYMLLLKRKQVEPPFYKKPLFVFAVGVLVGASATALVSAVVLSIRR